MRADMHKVICEEPRHGGGPQKTSRRANGPDELLPRFGGGRRPHKDRKSFGEHPGPLRPARRQPSWREREARKRAETCRWLNDKSALLKLNGCWFKCEMRPYPREENLIYDLASRQLLNQREAEQRYGIAVFCVRKRQLSR